MSAAGLFYWKQWLIGCKTMSSSVQNRSDQDNGASPQVKRYRTAISRQEFSKPVKALLAHRLLDQSTDFFDYGCGLGDDVRSLKELGFRAAGWDPVYSPGEVVQQSDVVNLGYVLNVIEDPAEREQALKAAYAIARKVLCVAVIVGASDYEGRSIPYGDGVLTTKDTFQKFFSQEELRQFIEHAVGASPVAVAPGVFFLFRDATAYNEFLLGRLRRSEIPTARGIVKRQGPSRQSALATEFQRNEEGLWRGYVDFIREYGRPPSSEEDTALERARTYGVQEAELVRAAREEIGEHVVNRTAESRRGELLVFLAISHFRRVPRLRELPTNMRHSIRFHFGSLDNAIAAGRERLMLVGDQDQIRQIAEAQSIGLNTTDGYFVPTLVIQLLPPVLQILIRMGELFYGDLSSTDLVKVHKNSPKVTFFIFDGFNSAPRPTLTTRIKIDLRQQSIRVFDHSGSENREVLVGRDLILDIQNLQKNNDERRLIDRVLKLRLPFGPVVKDSILSKMEL